MRSVRRFLVSAQLAAFLAGGSAGARELTWAESVRLASENNAELRAAEAAYRSTENLEGVARAGFLPEVAGVLDATRTGTSGSPEIIAVPGTQYSATLRGELSVFSGLSDAAGYSRAKANTRAAEASLRTTKAKVSYDLKSAFEGLRYAESVRTLSLDIAKRRESNLNLVQLRFESGRENKGSVLLSKAYLGQAKYEALQSENDSSVARVTLARVLGLDDAEEKLTAKDEVPISAPPGNAPDYRGLAAATPDHARAAAQEDAASAAVAVARAGFFPSLGASGTYGRKDDEFFPGAPDRWSLGVNLTVPIFSGGRDFYSTKSAGATYASSTANRVEIDRGLLVKLREAFGAYVEAVMKADVDAGFRDAAKLRAEIARTKYNNGLLTFEDWDLIENDFINRQKASLASTRDRVIAEAAWEQARGAGVIP